MLTRADIEKMVNHLYRQTGADRFFEEKEQAYNLYKDIDRHFRAEYDETGSIGKRYRRQDEIGTPYCITYDFESANDNCVTVRDRDTMLQDRVNVTQLRDYLEKRIEA